MVLVVVLDVLFIGWVFDVVIGIGIVVLMFVLKVVEVMGIDIVLVMIE